MKGTKFMTAKEKERVLKQWNTFLKYGCQAKHFTKPLYHHLIQHCSFIAHYDRAGFYATYFEEGEDTANFLSQFDNRNGIPNSIEYRMTYWYTDPEYNDLNSEMCRIASKYIDLLTGIAAARQKEVDILRARTLLAKHNLKAAIRQ